LVVGGGGSGCGVGACANSYNGGGQRRTEGGFGGEVITHDSFTIAEQTTSVVVGKGGNQAQGRADGGFSSGNNGSESKFGALTAAGGVRGNSWINGAPGWSGGTVSDITGHDVTYGRKGPTNNNGGGANAPANTGDGSGGAGNYNGAGAGRGGVASAGIVIVRFPYVEPVNP
ncbi:MAG: hypothetical protein LBC77_06620, partial [Spirochaetaceae bacterium]|nr:hypothetical protein [Spirochaetaceae bacterium]